jgi:tetratricopeptide (TPR) repeat protein
VPNDVNDQPFVTTAFAGLWLALSLCGCQSLQGNKHEVIVVDPATLDGGSGATELASQLNEQGIHYVLKEQLGKAEFKFQEATRIDPDFGPAYNNLGLVYFHQHDFFEAARAFEAASEKWPDSPEPLNNLGLVMDSVARPFDAMDLYQQAYERAPTNAEYLGNLLRTKVRMGLIDDELNSQLHSLLFIEKRIEWQDWAREQLALLHNPNLDRGPAKPSSDPLSELTERKESGELFYTPKSGSSSASSSDSNAWKKSDTNKDSLRLPAAIPEELPSLEPLRLPSPTVPPPSAAPLPVPPAVREPSLFPTSLPNSTRRNQSILEVLE